VALAAGLTSHLSRGRARSPRRADSGRVSRRVPRWAAAALAFGLGLNGVGLCLCAAQSVEACEPQGCCPHSGAHPEGTPETGPSLKASSASCCASQVTASGVAVRIDDRDILRHPLTPAATIYVSPADSIAASTFAASVSPLHSSSPPRRIVLRI